MIHAGRPRRKHEPTPTDRHRLIDTDWLDLGWLDTD